MKDSLGPAAEISEVLVAARAAATALPGFPGALPSSLSASYDIQDYSRACWPDEVVGWKVGGMPPKHADLFGQKFLAGPIFRSNLVRAVKGSRARMPAYSGGFMAIEPEFVVMLGADGRAGRVFIGAEIASSPLPAINNIGPLAVICDFGNNNGVLLGPEVPDWQTQLAQPVEVSVLLNGKEVGRRKLDSIVENTAEVIDFIIEHSTRRGIDLPEGTLISTGAITGIHEAVIGDQAEIHFERLGSITLELEAAKPLK